MIKKELLDWSFHEIAGMIIVISAILYNVIVLNDSITAVLSAICGILYTVIAGKGKIYCYIYGWN